MSAGERAESKRKQKTLLAAGREAKRLADTPGPVTQDNLGAVAHAPRGLKNWSSKGTAVRSATKLAVDEKVAAARVSFLPTPAQSSVFTHARPTSSTNASIAAASAAAAAKGALRLPQLVIASYMGAVMGVQLVADRLPTAPGSSYASTSNNDAHAHDDDDDDDDVKVKEEGETKDLIDSSSTSGPTPTSTRVKKATFRSRFSNAEAHVGSVRSLAASSTGNVFVSGGQDEIIRVYDMKKLKEFGTLHRHEGSVNVMKMFSDSHLVSAGGDGKVLIWTSTNWTCLSLLRGHKYVCLSPFYLPSYIINGL
jgi:hypothetical protein